MQLRVPLLYELHDSLDLSLSELDCLQPYVLAFDKHENIGASPAKGDECGNSSRQASKHCACDVDHYRYNQGMQNKEHDVSVVGQPVLPIV